MKCSKFISNPPAQFIYVELKYILLLSHTYIVDTAKIKWKNLRDTFRKQKILVDSKRRSGAGASGGSTWMWYKHMTFLTTSMFPPEYVFQL